MGQIKNNTYTLYIYNGGVDSQNSDAKIEIRYNNLTKIDNCSIIIQLNKGEEGAKNDKRKN